MAAVVVALGGGLLISVSVRRAVANISPGQAAIVATKIGDDFMIASWSALAAWGITGYWLLARLGLGDLGSPYALFINPDFLGTGIGNAMFIMVAAWYILVINAILIMLVYRPRLRRRVEPAADTSADAFAATLAAIASGARGINNLAIANLVVTFVAFVAAKLYF